MKILQTGLIAVAVLVGSTLVASASDVCFELTPPNVASPTVSTSTTLVVGRAFGSLPSAGTCKEFRGFMTGGPQTVWTTGEACASSDNVDISFVLSWYGSTYRQFGSVFFPIDRSTLTGVARVCSADTTGAGGGCQAPIATKVVCPSPVTVPEAALPTCPGLC
jgi:hypothetical protein